MDGLGYRHTRRTTRDPRVTTTLRRRSAGHCEWDRVVVVTPGLTAAAPCRSYGTAAVHIAPSDHTPAGWAWLCRPHQLAAGRC